MDSLEILRDATKRGVRTSEFWLSVASIVAIVWGDTLNGVAVAIVAAAYGMSRAIVKAVTSRALLTGVQPPIALEETAESRDRR